MYWQSCNFLIIESKIIISGSMVLCKILISGCMLVWNILIQIIFKIWKINIYVHKLNPNYLFCPNTSVIHVLWNVLHFRLFHFRLGDLNRKCNNRKSNNSLEIFEYLIVRFSLPAIWFDEIFLIQIIFKIWNLCWLIEFEEN